MCVWFMIGSRIAGKKNSLKVKFMNNNLLIQQILKFTFKLLNTFPYSIYSVIRLLRWQLICDFDKSLNVIYLVMLAEFHTKHRL